MHRSEPSRLQALALQLTDKVNNFVDSNERIFEMKQGNKYWLLNFQIFAKKIFFPGNFFARGGGQGFRDRQNYNRGGQGGRQRRDRDREQRNREDN